MSAASHFRPQGEIPVQFEHRAGRRCRVAERHHEPAFVLAGEPPTPNASVPAAMVVVPEYVFAPESASAPPPIFVRPPE